MSEEGERFVSERQKSYETRRRARILGLAIDQCIQGIKNVVVYGDPKWWDPVDKMRWENIKDNSENILVDLMALERKLSNMVDIYATMLAGPEATYPYENPAKNKN